MCKRGFSDNHPACEPLALSWECSLNCMTAMEPDQKLTLPALRTPGCVFVGAGDSGPRVDGPISMRFALEATALTLELKFWPRFRF